MKDVIEDPKLFIVIAAGIGATWLGVLGYILCKSKSSQKFNAIDKDLADYKLMLKEVAEERIQIIEAIDNITKARSTESPLAHDAIHKFFSANTIMLYQRYLQKKAEAEELSSQYDELINSYPYHSVEQARNEPYSIKIFHNEILEHHEKVKIIALECLNRVNNTNYQQLKSVTISL